MRPCAAARPWTGPLVLLRCLSNSQKILKREFDNLMKESGQTRTEDTRTRCCYNDANPMWSEAQAEQAEQSSGSEAASNAAGARLN